MPNFEGLWLFPSTELTLNYQTLNKENVKKIISFAIFIDNVHNIEHVQYKPCNKSISSFPKPVDNFVWPVEPGEG